MSFLDKMEQKADKLEKSANERTTILQEIRKENANLGREEGRGARIVTTMVALTVIVWAILFLFDFVNGVNFTGTTALMCTVLVGLYWGNYRESHDRTSAIYLVIALVALVILLVLHFVPVFLK